MARITESPRSRNTRKIGFTVLIVCEGEKTERIYFNNYRRRNAGIRVEIPNTSETDPINLLRHAILKADELGITKKNGSVWVVFDCDANRDRDLLRVKSLANKNKINIIFSNPSFEIWYLLHYVHSTANLSNANLKRELKKYIPNYDKAKCYFSQLRGYQNDAITNADYLNEYHIQQDREVVSRESNPSSQVFILIEHLNSLVNV
jgi:hypothetical protein